MRREPAIAAAQRFQLAVTRGMLFRARRRVIVEQKARENLAVLFDFIAIRYDQHAVFAWSDAGSRQHAPADVDDAHAADADGIELWRMAKGRNVDANGVRRVPNRGARGHLAYAI